MRSHHLYTLNNSNGRKYNSRRGAIDRRVARARKITAVIRGYAKFRGLDP